MGGGNTYALLKRLRESGLLPAVRERVQAGMPYLGASAGSNVAGPTILTTNDWNVVALDRFDAFAFARRIPLHALAARCVGGPECFEGLRVVAVVFQRLRVGETDELARAR